MTKHVSLDLETLGVAPGSTILAIGAYEITTGQEFYATISLESSAYRGFSVNMDTLRWWHKQSQEARDEAFSGTSSLLSVLFDFSDWLKDLPEEYEPLCVWGNGATFDNVLLATAYTKMKFDVPWNTYHDRCFRTLKEANPDIPYIKPQFAHHALEDAKAQGLHIAKLLGIQSCT
jgi:exodeoxyribonuclease VIII